MKIAKLLREAYVLLRDADTSDIDSYYLEVQEAMGFVAEALDLADEGDL